MLQHYNIFLAVLLLGGSLFSATSFSIVPSFGITRPQNAIQLFSSTKDDEIPTMDWLTDSLSTAAEGDNKNDADFEKVFIQEHDSEDVLGGEETPIPSTGVSVSDEMVKTQKERFFTELVQIKKGLSEDVKVGQIISTTTAGSFDPVRYIIGLDKESSTTNTDANSFVLVDVPPYSDQLVNEIKEFMGSSGSLAAILITNKECIHYDDAPGVFSIRRADLLKWEKAFPESHIAGYRLDIPRDCRASITQILDGYGPFALQESDNSNNATFVETGRPLTYEEWDYDVTQDIFAGKETPPDDNVTLVDDSELYSSEAIRSREDGKRVLAVYTPGRTYGSVSYVFPELELVACGFTIPVEDSRSEENTGMDSAGPALDARGYITTSKAGTARQMESARMLVETYVDRFTTILPSSRSDPYFMNGSSEERKRELLSIIDQYEKIGQIYENLGITDYSDDTEDV